jgi:F0F1-type ATP synthase membrane subunit b/b'
MKDAAKARALNVKNKVQRDKIKATADYEAANKIEEIKDRAKQEKERLSQGGY